MTLDKEPEKAVRKPRRLRYRGSGALAMCGPGPHPGGALFRSLCTLADRFRASPDAEASKIGGVLSALAVHAAEAGDRDFRYSFGSFVMDLALADETVPVSGQRMVGSDHLAGYAGRKLR